jgi:uncharacterized iron-regulated membrane protein
MRLLALAHRWTGVVLCLFFAAWFFSGAVLIYHPFPSLPQAERLAPRINFSKIQVPPKAVISIKNSLDRLRLINVEGQPTYVLHPINGPVITIGADDGKPLNLLGEKAAGKIAENFIGKPLLKIEGPFNYDQWIVPNHYDPYRPFFRIYIQDRKATELYVSARTGEVLQKTEGTERAWNYVGAITHWIYPTLLRSNWALWDGVVWWMSLLGVLTALAGLVLGITRLRESKTENRFGSPFKGWLRIHHILGLLAGTLVLTWIFSGWLSMDHGRLFSKPSPEASQIRNFRGISLKQAVQQISLEALKSLKDFSEVEFIATGGQLFVKGRNLKGSKVYKPLSPNILLPAEFAEPEIINAVKKAWPDVKIQFTQWPDESDIYGNLREGSLPENTLRVVLDDQNQSWVHIDMESGQIVSVMDKSRRLYRWLFNGLHSLDFPGLANHRPLWDVLILLMLGVGFLFSITGVVVGGKRLFNR